MKTLVRVILAAALSALVMACSNPLVTQIREQIVADYEEVFWFGEDEIGFDFTYTSVDFELSETKPIYIVVFPVPLSAPASQDDLVFLTQYPITENGRYVIPREDLPADQGIFLFVHDLNNSLPDDGETDDNSDTQYVVNTAASGGFTASEGAAIFAIDPDTSGPLIEDGNYVLNDEFVLSVGESYEVAYEDGSNYTEDAFESLDTPGSFRSIDQGTYETARNLHTVGDVDYLEFTAPTSDDYIVRVKATAYNVSVSLYTSDSDAVTDNNAIASSTGNTARIINPSNTGLTGGATYYLRIESPENGLGPYDIGFFYEPVTADSYENDDSRGTAGSLPIGRGNEQSRTLEPTESDWVALDVQDGFNYIVEVSEDPGFNDSRSPQFDFRLESGSGSGVQGGYVIDGTKRLILDPGSTGYGGAGTYYLQISNDTPVIGDEDYPSFGYDVLYAIGPDYADEPDDPRTPSTDEYALWNEHASFYPVPYVPYGTDGRIRTIYSTETGEDPEDDVDWFSFTVEDIFDYILIKSQPEGSAEPVVVNFQVFPSKYDSADIVPDTTSPVASGQAWVGDDTVFGTEFYPLTARSYVDESNPSSLEAKWWIRVERDASYPSNPLTGAYRVTVQAAPDQQDSYYASSSENDAQVTMIDASGATIAGSPFGVDETPYLGIRNQQTPSTDYSDRNKLVWTGTTGNYEIETVYNSIYRKDYMFRGEPDGVNDPSTDHEFYWFETPASLSSSEFLILGYSSTDPEIPLKLTYWELTPAEFSAAISDEVVTESDLDGYDTPTVVPSVYLTGEIAEKIEHTVSVSGSGNYYFIKVERDSSRTTYTDNDGNLRTYAQTGRYRLLFWD